MSPTDRWVKFGRWVEEQRTARRLSKTEACRLSGLSPSSWYNIEHGGRVKDGRRIVHQPSTETLFGIATAFDMDPFEVFQAAGVPPPARYAPPEPMETPLEPAVALPAAIASTNADAGLLALLAQLLAEQRELRATLQALREEVAHLRASPSRR